MADRYDDRYRSDPYTSGRGFATRDDRNLFERAGEEVRSWFRGDDRHHPDEPYRRERGREYERDDRRFPERAGDEVRSWFGDEEAERRRRMDEQEQMRRERMYGYDRDEYGRGADVTSTRPRSMASPSHPTRPDWTPERWERPERGTGSRYASGYRGWGESDYVARPPYPYEGQSLDRGWESERSRGPGESRGVYEDDRGRVHHFEHGTDNFAGRGPKGYRRNDERVREDVCDRLTEDARIDATDIEIAVNNGEVTLSGVVNSRGEKRRAEDLVENISGVREVHNNLRVSRSQEIGRSI